MIEKLSVITIVVKDQSKALDFYTNVLGFEKRTDFTPQGNQRWVTVAPKGQEVEMSLFQAGSVPDPNAPQNRWRPGVAPTWTFKTNDLRKDFQELRSKGVKFNEKEPGEYPWGLVATFTDPDGNNFSLLQQPSK